MSDKGKAVAVFAVALLMAMTISGLVRGHTPASLLLEYDFQTQTLYVNITHVVADPNTHYIVSVEIVKNSVQFDFVTYTSQPSTTSFSYQYNVPAVDGDVIEVTITCVISGFRTEQITVVDPNPPDVEDPTISITTPTSNEVHNTDTTPVSLGGTASDNVGVVFVNWTNNATGGSGAATGTTSWSADVPLAEGENNITVTADDAAGNSASDNITVVYTPSAPDTEDPVVSITSPTTGQTYETDSSPITIGGTATDNVGIAIVSWSNTATAGSGTASGTDSWTATIGLAEGENNITVTATDSAGNTGTDNITVIYEFTPPDLPDGVISVGEYAFEAIIAGGDYKLYWRLDGQEIHLGIVAETTGWVALGIDPGTRMKDADMILGWVNQDGSVNMTDAYATGETGPHPPDRSLGGNRDIYGYNGTESGGSTTIEFSRLLSTGDSYDKVIPQEGRLKILWAFGPTDEFTQQHVRRGKAIIDLGAGLVSEEESPTLWPIHAALMTLGFVFMLVGVIISTTQRKKKWWLKTHRLMGILGSLFAILGLVMGFYMISAAGGTHFRVPHTYLGLVTIILAVAQPLMGLRIPKTKKLRPVHRWTGRITVVLMLLTVISGLIQARVI